MKMEYVDLDLRKILSFLLFFCVIIYFVFFYGKSKFKKNESKDFSLSHSERRYPFMRMYRLIVKDEETVVFSCVVSSDDLNNSVSYWLDHGNYSVTIGR